MWGLETITSTDATIRFAIRARPSSETQEAARELRHRMYSALLQARILATAPKAPPPHAGPAEPAPEEAAAPSASPADIASAADAARASEQHAEPASETIFPAVP